MTSYTITHKTSGLDLGTYEAATPADAIAAMRLDAGYSDSAALAETLGCTVADLDAELSVEDAVVAVVAS